MKEAGLMDVKNYFNLSSSEFMKQWKSLNDEERKWWKVELGKVLYPGENNER